MGGGRPRLAETHPGAGRVGGQPGTPRRAEVAAAGRLTGLPVKVDCGANDPFAPPPAPSPPPSPWPRWPWPRAATTAASGSTRPRPSSRFLAAAFTALQVTDGTATR